MSTQEGQPAAPQGAGKKLPILLASVLALAGVGLVTYRELAPRPAPEQPGARRSVVVDPAVVELEPLVVNLHDPTGDRYFRLVVQLVLDQRPIAQRTAEGRPQAILRDRLLAVLSKKRASQLTTVAGKEQLRTELHEAAEGLMGEVPFHDPEQDPAPARVLDVLFTEFLLQ